VSANRDAIPVSLSAISGVLGTVLKSPPISVGPGNCESQFSSSPTSASRSGSRDPLLLFGQLDDPGSSGVRWTIVTLTNVPDTRTDSFANPRACSHSLQCQLRVVAFDPDTTGA